MALKGTIEVASDKSLSHRALIFSALAEGESQIQNLLLSEDVLCTLKILNQLGVKTYPTADEIQNGLQEFASLRVHGVGLRGLQGANEVLYCGNSGTTMRLMLGLLSAQKFDSVLTGDDSLNKRPMDRVTKPLAQTGARFAVKEENGKRLLHCFARDDDNPVKGIHYDSPVASAQVKTCLLLSGLYAEEKTVLTEPSLSRNHTEILFQNQGVDLKTEMSESSPHITLTPGKRLNPINFTVPSDISSAAFFMVAASLVVGSDVVLKNVNLNPTRTGILDVLLEMQANIAIQNQRQMCGEEVADLRVQASTLKNTKVAGDTIPRLVDEIPILALAGSFAEGVMQVRDAKELRVKETDRIAAIENNLKKLGVKIESTEDGFDLVGQSGDWQNDKTILWETHHDHRIAMMGSIAKLATGCDIQLDDEACVQTSFPNFFELLEKIQS